MSIDLAKAQETGEPIGTAEKLKEFGLDPIRFGSCSPYIKDQNKGCGAYHHCRFREYRDRLQGRSGPGNIGVLMITPQGAAANHIKSCYQYYQAGDDARRRNADVNGWVVKIVGLEGDTVKDRGSRMLHAKRDTNCPACQKGNCQKMQQYVEPRVIPKFPRLGEVQEGETDEIGFAMEMRKLLIDEVDTEKQNVALTGINTPKALDDPGRKQAK